MSREEEEEEGSEPWTLIERGLEELQEGAKKIIQGIENLKTGLKNVHFRTEEISREPCFCSVYML